jgi:uncharacterized integral membrane protein
MMPLLQIIWRMGFIAIRVILFLLLLTIAITNTNSVEFHWFINQSTQIPLNFLLLGAFLMGLLLSAGALVVSRRRT